MTLTVLKGGLAVLTNLQERTARKEAADAVFCVPLCPLW